jgi:hypothetical protein
MMQIYDPNELFERIQQHITSHKTHEKGAIRQHYNALADVYLLGIYLIKQNTLQDFIKARDPKLWNKTAEKKPFQPLIKLAFADFPKATISQQTTVLTHCYENSYSVDDFRDDLNQRGLVAIRNDAQKQKKNEVIPKRFELSLQEENDWLQEQFKNQTAICELNMDTDTASAAGIQDQQILQLAARWENGKLHIIDHVKMGDDETAVFLKQIVGTPPKQNLKRLSEKSLFGLFHAADIFARFRNNPMDFVDDTAWTDTGSSTIPKQLLAKTCLLFEFNKDKWTARTISELPTFRCVYVEIDDPLENLDREKRHILTSASCAVLADGFLNEGEWEIISGHNGTVCTCSAQSISVEFIDFDQMTTTGFDQLDPNRTDELSFKMPLNKLRRIIHWRDEHKAKGQKHIPFPNSFAFKAHDNNQINLTFPLNEMVTKPLLENVQIQGNDDLTDRFLLEKDIAALTYLALDYDLSFKGSIFSTFETNNGIQINLNDGTNAFVALPLAISLQGDLGQITEGM